MTYGESRFAAPRHKSPRLSCYGKLWRSGGFRCRLPPPYGKRPHSADVIGLGLAFPPHGKRPHSADVIGLGLAFPRRQHLAGPYRFRCSSS
jgi:hypothetical protein